MTRLAIVLRDLALVLLVGGTLGVSTAALVVFDEAPTREIAGRIGMSVFDVASRAILLAAAVLVAAGIVLRRREPSPGNRINLFLSTGVFVVAALIALWLTPAMGEIWATAPHDPAGGGLAGEERRRFMMMHGIGNLGYLAIVVAGIVLVILRPRAARRA